MRRRRVDENSLEGPRVPGARGRRADWSGRGIPGLQEAGDAAALDGEDRGDAGAAGARRLSHQPRHRLPPLPFGAHGRPLRHSPQAGHAKGRAAFPSTRSSVCRASCRRRTSRPTRKTASATGPTARSSAPIREGVDRNGVALFPMMPYEEFREMSDEDVKSIVVYLRTLKPIRHVIAPRRLDFPVGWMIKFAPKPVDGPIATPDPAKDGVAYGKYLVTPRGMSRLPHAARRQGPADRGPRLLGRMGDGRARGDRSSRPTSRRIRTPISARPRRRSSSGGSSPSRAWKARTRRSLLRG